MMEEKAATRVLLVEDDEELTRVNTLRLKSRGYEVLCAANGRETFEVFESTRVDIILLDVMLPDMDGHEICEKLRDEPYGYSGPIIFMSCLGDSQNIVGAFREGGNDYLVKPAKLEELVERIEANLAKASLDRNEDNMLWFDSFMVNTGAHSVYRVADGIKKDKVELSPTEYNILMVLVKRPQEVILYRELYKAVWEQEDAGDVRTLMVHVSNLRKKISPDGGEFIRAVRGVGYIFDGM